MELRQLSYLNTIYTARSFTKAARQHYTSQPNITTAIRKLEEELNTTLIDRDTRPLSFTEAGEFFMPYVKNILLSVNEGKAALNQYLKKSLPRLNVCISSSVGNGLLPLLYTEFTSLYPGMEFMSYDLTMEMILDFLWAEEIEIAYTIMPEQMDLDRYQVTLLQKGELCLLINRQHPLAQMDSISFDMLKNERIITFPDGSLILNRLQSCAAMEGASLDIHKVAQTFVMEEMVRTNYGIATAIRNSFNADREDVDYVMKSFQEPILFEEGFIIKKGRKLSGPTQAFQEFILDKVGP